MGRSRSRDDARPNRPRSPIAWRQARRAARVYDANRATRIGDHRNRRPSSGARRRDERERGAGRLRADRSGLAVLLVLRHRADGRRVLRQLPGLSPASSAQAGARKGRGGCGAGYDQRGLVGGPGAADEGDRSPRRRALRRARRGALSHLVRKNDRRIGARPRRAQTHGPAARRDNHQEHSAATPRRAARLTHRRRGRADVPILVARQHRFGGRVSEWRPTAWSCNGSRAKRSRFRPATSAPWRRSAAAIREQTRTLEIHRDDRAYATTVQNNNTPLFFLNLGLGLRRRGPGISDLRPSRDAMERQSTRRSSSFERIGDRSRQTRTRRFKRAARRSHRLARASDASSI